MRSNASDVRIILSTISGGPAGVSVAESKSVDVNAPLLPDSQPFVLSTGGESQ